MKDYQSYLNKTIEYLESNYWGNIPLDASALIQKCYALRKKKLSDFTVEDLRVMIGQKEGIKYLLPIAIDLLNKDPFVEGDYYEGDLLQSVLSCDCTFWKQNSTLHVSMVAVVNKAKSLIGDYDLLNEIKEKLINLIHQFEDCSSNW